MISASDRVRLIFGLKLRQLRQDKGLQINELADLAGISPSYLNEIEKGKKYPKSEKIFALARVLDTHYDNLVSVSLGKRLEPIEELLNSNILQELPLDLFGLEAADLLRMLSEAPVKLGAFVSTVIEISRNHGLNVEQFFFSALRSFQELHDNYFEEIEEIADRFTGDFLPGNEATFREEWLKEHLEKSYGYQVVEFDEEEMPELSGLRSVVLPGSPSVMFVNRRLGAQQRAFTFGREIGFRLMELYPRPYVSSQTEAESFDQVLHNFKASYFAGAILVPREPLVTGLAGFFAGSAWKPGKFLELMDKFDATPEIFMQRISNVMSRHFGVQELFFLRFDNELHSNSLTLTKEMHTAKLPFIHSSANEHYCRLWVSLTILDDLARLQKAGEWDGGALCRAQIASFLDTSNSYLVISLARDSPPRKGYNSSISLGFPLNERVRTLVRFLDDPALDRKGVSQTCERCRLEDCSERSWAPVVWRRMQRNRTLREFIPGLREALAAKAADPGGGA